ncbi:protein RCC2 isoform X1 [Vespula maculifrons]|uniref:Protein RCC2 isoform X1 n=1 Tax=Vespula maculifrons TaxID=7453 RepID=A0ABD2BXK7_VESMC
MSKRKNTTVKKGRAKSRKVEYDEEDISSEHESDVEDAESGTNVDGEDAAEDDLTDVSNIPELPSPEVNTNIDAKTVIPEEESQVIPMLMSLAIST